MKKQMRNYSSWLTAVLVLTLISNSGSAQKVEPKVKIGPDTTYIDGPLTKDGYIDYVAHLNQTLSKGVTPENNAAVLLLKASLGEISNEKFLKMYCKALGIKPLPLKGDYFLDYHSYAFKKKKEELKRDLTSQERNAAFEAIDKDFEKASKGPWKADEIPSIAAWVKDSKKHLELVRKATLRSKYYHPMLNFSDDDDDDELKGAMIAVLLPQAQATRSFARSLLVRSMMYLGEDEIDKCTEDILTMRRLGNHVAKGATLVEQLVGIAIVGIAQSVEQKVALSGKLSSKQLLAYRDKMQKARAKTNMLRSFSECERFMYLDSVQMVMRGGVRSLNQLSGMADGGRPETRMQQMLDKVISGSTDWSFTMRAGNEIYDKYENELNTDDWIEQDKAMQKMEDEIQKISKEVNGASTMVKAFLGGPEYRGKLMGKVFVGLLLPALNAASTAEKRIQVMDDLSYIVISAAAQKAETGDYPRSLADFSKRIVDELPIDKYANDDYRFRREGDGFVVYSIGPNRKDDNGNGVFNEKHDRGDDYGAGYESAPKNVKTDGVFR